MSAEWYCQIHEVVYGPLTIQDVKRMASCGKLAQSDLLRRGDSGKWLTAGSVMGLTFVAKAHSAGRSSGPAQARRVWPWLAGTSAIVAIFASIAIWLIQRDRKVQPETPLSPVAKNPPPPVHAKPDPSTNDTGSRVSANLGIRPKPEQHSKTEHLLKEQSKPKTHANPESLPGAKGKRIEFIGNPDAGIGLGNIYVVERFDLETKERTYPMTFPAGTKALNLILEFANEREGNINVKYQVRSNAGPLAMLQGPSAFLRTTPQVMLIPVIPDQRLFTDGPYQMTVTINDKRIAVLNWSVGSGGTGPPPVGTSREKGRQDTFPGAKGPVYEYVGNSDAKVTGADVNVTVSSPNPDKPPKSRTLPSGTKELWLAVKFERKPEAATISILVYDQKGTVELADGRIALFREENIRTGEYVVRIPWRPQTGKFADGPHQACVKLDDKVVALVNWEIGDPKK